MKGNSRDKSAKNEVNETISSENNVNIKQNVCRLLLATCLNKSYRCLYLFFYTYNIYYFANSNEIFSHLILKLSERHKYCEYIIIYSIRDWILV